MRRPHAPRVALACALLALPAPAAPQSPPPTRSGATSAARLPTRFSVDASHSAVAFVVRFMGLSTVRGAFGGVSGTVMYAEGEPERSSVSVVIDASSVNTNARTRDDHLRSPDFLDVAKYPTIAFRSTRVARSPSGFTARGTLTLHGVSREVDVPFVQLNAPVKDAWGNSRVTFQGALRLSRKEYGVLGTAFWNGEFDPGRFAVSDDVDVELLVSATVANPMRWSDRLGDSLHASVERDGVEEAARRFRAAFVGNPRVDSLPGFAFLVVGERLAAAGRARDAAHFYEAVLEARPASPAVRLQLGEAYVKTGELARARREFERVLRESPQSTAAAEWLRVLPP